MNFGVTAATGGRQETFGNDENDNSGWLAPSTKTEQEKDNGGSKDDGVDLFWASFLRVEACFSLYPYC